VARPGGRADIRDHGTVDGLFQRRAGHDLHGDAQRISDERNDADVSADGRFSFIALVEITCVSMFLAVYGGYASRQTTNPVMQMMIPKLREHI
jgi:hypothetical protein